MNDAPALGTMLFLVVIFATYALLVRFVRHSRRTANAALFVDYLAHWHYSPAEWRTWCERQRHELWFETLRPTARYLLPGLAAAGTLGFTVGRHAQLGIGVASLLALLVVFVIANTVIGPTLHSYLRLSRRRLLDYELHLRPDGALETWSNAVGVKATEVHPFTDDAARLEGVETREGDPAEIVFTIARPLAFGFQRSEKRFPVPRDRLDEAREIAQRLTPGKGPDPDRGS